MSQFSGSPSSLLLWEDDDGQFHTLTQAEGGATLCLLMPALFSLAQHPVVEGIQRRGTTSGCWFSWTTFESCATPTGLPAFSTTFCNPGPLWQDQVMEPWWRGAQWYSSVVPTPQCGVATKRFPHQSKGSESWGRLNCLSNTTL